MKAQDLMIGSHSRITSFLTKDGLKLKGILFSHARRPGTCIVYVHGMSGSLLSSIPLSFARHLGRDLAVFSFNNRGSSMVSGFSRYVKGRRKTTTIGTNLERFEDCIYDIKGAVDEAHRLGFRNIVLCGHSTGCQKTAYYQHMTKDRRISALVLIAPCDDYALNMKRLGSSHDFVSKACSTMIAAGQDDDIAPDSSGYSAQRLDSLINLGRVEARLFDYGGPLKEFSSIKAPTLAIFGNEEENAVTPVGECLDILEDRTGSGKFSKMLIRGATHSFEGYEDELVAKVESWIRRL